MPKQLTRLAAMCMVALCYTASLQPTQISQAATSSPRPGTADGSAPATLGAFKRRFLFKQVVVNDVPFEQNYCLEWTLAQRNDAGAYVPAPGIENHLPLTYRGRTATVVSIALSSTQQSPPATNAFGERVSADEIEDPYLEVAVEFRDSTIAIISGYPETLVPDRMEGEDDHLAAQSAIEEILPSVIGRQLYAVASSRIYKPTASLDEIAGQYERLVRLPAESVPLLEPLTVVKAKYLPENGGVLLELRLPSGAIGICYTPREEIDLTQHDPVARFSGSLLDSIPKTLTPREITAIRRGELFRGMSEDAVMFALGPFDHENDWGLGGRQLVFFDGTLLIYLDRAGKVIDWQSLNKDN